MSNLEEEYTQEEFKEFTTKHGELRAILGKNELEIESIEDSIFQNSEMSENKIEKMIKYFIENNLKVGFISSFEIYEGSRGFGHGSELMKEFEDNIMKNSDVDILLARTKNEQSEGFVLENFYKKYGFKGIVLEDGDLLMVSKGFDLVLEDVLNLKEEREMIANYFNKNTPKNDTQNDMLNFITKKIKETNNSSLKVKRKL